MSTQWYNSVISWSSSSMFASWESARKASKCPLLRKCLRISRMVNFSFCSLYFCKMLQNVKSSSIPNNSTYQIEKLNDGPYERSGITWMYKTGKSSCSMVLCFNSNTSGVESFLSPLEKQNSSWMYKYLYQNPSSSPFKQLAEIFDFHSAHYTKLL